MADDDLYNLEFLSLVAKITQEIDNHTGINDKTLAEFVISLHEQAKGKLDSFKTKLKEAGAGFPESFVENVDRLILSLHPKYKKKKKKGSKGKDKALDEELDELDRKRRLFPGLALQNKEPEPVPVDDVFLKELGDLVSGKSRPAPRDEDGRSPKRQRRDRSWSPPRGRSPSPIRGRDGGRRGGRMALDDKPVLYKVYDGRVSGLQAFGAFVQLDGVAGRAEGTL